VARRITGLDDPTGRATEMLKLFSTRPAPTLHGRLAFIFLVSQTNYCVDKGRVAHYIPRCSEVTIHAKFFEKMWSVLKSTC
jgi:hypothetical protein